MGCDGAVEYEIKPNQLETTTNGGVHLCRAKQKQAGKAGMKGVRHAREWANGRLNGC